MPTKKFGSQQIMFLNSFRSGGSLFVFLHHDLHIGKGITVNDAGYEYSHEN